MTLRIFRSRAARLLAILAVALQAFWPLLAQAKPGPRTMRVELCTIDGTTHYAEIPVGGEVPAEKRAPGYSGHCAMCVTGGERALAGPPVWVPPIALESIASERPPANAGAQFASTSHRPAQSRAPPRSL
jgi:hypothetical protein